MGLCVPAPRCWTSTTGWTAFQVGVWWLGHATWREHPHSENSVHSALPGLLLGLDKDVLAVPLECVSLQPRADNQVRTWGSFELRPPQLSSPCYPCD